MCQTGKECSSITGTQVNSVGKCKYFLPSFILCSLGHGAGTPVEGGNCGAGSAQCLPLCQVQRVFWEAVCQSRLLDCPAYGLYDQNTVCLCGRVAGSRCASFLV